MPVEDLLHPLLKHYIGAPAWIKESVGTAYARLPRALRWGSAYGAFRDEIEASRRAPARLAMEKLDATLRWAIETVPAYRRYRGMAARHADPRELLEKLPVVDKLDIKRDTASYLSGAMPPAARLKTFTGGSTRNPMEFYLHKHVSRPKEYAFMEEFRRRAGAGAEDLTLALRGRSVPGATAPEGTLAMLEPIKRQLILSTDHLEERYMPRYAEALLEHRPKFIEAYASALYPLVRWLKAHPLPEFTEGVKGVMLYSENVHEHQMRAFREAFACPVLKHYGHSERVLMAASMPDDERYFFWPQYGWLELLDDQGRRVSRPGQLGHIVGTSFDNKVMPFVRYRTGDLAVLGGAEHPVLPGFPVCERIEGRLQEFLVCRDHRLISITTIGAAHLSELAAAEAIQYEQDAPGEVTVKVIMRGALTPQIQARIAEAIREKTQGGCEARVVLVERLERTPRGKLQMLVQRLDLSSYFGAAAGA